MDKASVVALRTALLKDGENRSVKIAFDNGIVMSQASDVIIWDDDKEIVIAFTSDSNSGSYLAGLPISVISSTYENIQFIMGNTNVENLESVIDGLASATDKITDEDKNKIIEWYKKVYSHEHELYRKNYNPTDIVRD